jgi:hypothetical protein
VALTSLRGPARVPADRNSRNRNALAPSSGPPTYELTEVALLGAKELVARGALGTPPLIGLARARS